MDMREERAFRSDCFPCNSLPFLCRMVAILQENSTNNPGPLSPSPKADYDACLWIVMGQAHGQMATINLNDEWDRLNKAIPKEAPGDEYQVDRAIRELRNLG
jgi:hypothetical protein